MTTASLNPRAVAAYGSLRSTTLFATGYFVCCLVGQLLSLPGEVPFATIWPAAGLYLAVLTLAERRDWPQLIGGAVLANLVFNVALQDRPLGTSLLYCLANTAEAVIGSGILKGLRWKHGQLSQFQQSMGLSVAGVVGGACGASLGMLATTLNGSPVDAQWLFLWWSADVVGILLVAPVVLSGTLPGSLGTSLLRSPWRLLELTALLGLLAARTWTAGQIEEYSVRALPLGMLPLLVWAAVRFGVRGVSLALLLFFALQVQATISGRGLFALGNDPLELRILFLQGAAGFLGFSFVSLASVIEDRNRALEDAKRLRAEAERASSAKSQFLANMSHELRTPMNGILGMLEVVSQSELTPGQRERIGLVRRSADALLALVNDILDLSKVEAGRLELRPEEFSLRAGLDEVLRLIEPQLQNRQVSLACRISPDVPDLLRADRGRLRQVLLNLLGNAVKFTHEGSIRLDVDVASRVEAVRVLHFCVSDTGIGISPLVQERLFDRFEQGHSHESYGGTGLGLAIARQLVILMGGRMWLESERGRGSQFHFTIATTAVEPLLSADIETVDDAETARIVRGTSTVSLPMSTGRPVLLVEDDPVSALVASTILENAGFRVEVANHGGEAVELWRSQQFACVLSDMRMPVMNGLELARTIRDHEQPQGLRTPIIILTANSQPTEYEQCAAAGIDAYLTKPLQMEELLGAIQRLSSEPPGSIDNR